VAKPKPTDRRANIHALILNLEGRYRELMATEPRKRQELTLGPKVPAIYVFSESGKHVYVGRTRNLRSRLAQHMRASGSHNTASFAFRLAKDSAHRSKIDLPRFGKDIEALPAFQPLFTRAKRRVSRMDVQFLQVCDPIEQTLLEIYVAESLATPYNDFDTH
jgi:hypothetical protein